MHAVMDSCEPDARESDEVAGGAFVLPFLGASAKGAMAYADGAHDGHMSRYDWIRVDGAVAVGSIERAGASDIQRRHITYVEKK